MKYLGVILLIMIGFVSNAQDTHAVKDKINSLKNKLETKRDVTDTLKLPTDSLKLKSLKDKLERRRDLADTKLPTDSLRLKSLTIDSLTKAQPPAVTSKILAGQDSISKKISNKTNLVTELAAEKTTALQGEIQSNADSTANVVSDKAQALQLKVEEKVSLDGKKIDLPSSENKLPDLSATGVKIPEVNNAIPKVDSAIPSIDTKSISNKIPQEELKLPTGLSLPTETKIPELKTELPNTEKVKALGENIPDVPDSTNKPDLSILKEVPGTEKVTSKVDAITGLHDEAGKYKEQFKDLKETNIEDIDTKELEQQAMKIGDVKELDAQTQKLKAAQAQHAALLQKYNDKKLIQEEMKRKTANIANDQLGKFSPAINDAKLNMAKTKKTYRNSATAVDSIKRIKRENSMAGKPLKKRIVPGITFQTYSGKNEILLDVSPQVGYRLTGWLTVGVAGVYRIGLGKGNPSFMETKNIHGYRLHADYSLVKGIFAHGDFESLHVGSSEFSLKEYPAQRVKGSYFGIGKHYMISRNFKGSLLALFRVNYSGSIPGQSKFAVRVGFDYVFKKKRKIT